jgi:hypothetical protein
MNTRKIIVYGLIAVLLTPALALATITLSMTGCEQPTDNTPTLTGITADYTGGSVAINTNVNSLKSNLTVTAKYSDNTGKTLNAADYSLSGDLSASGQKTVTVSYEGETTTFTVTVTAATGTNDGTTKEKAIPLTENTWVDGRLPTANGEQWFVFTAAASTQYIHADFGTLASLYVQVYDSGDTVVESETDLHGSITNTSRTLTAGQAYYIRVRPYDSSNNSGTYRIGFNTSIVPPGITPITLTANQWAEGSLPPSDDYQWFVFTAAVSTQYIIHFSTTGTLKDVYVQVYDSGGAEVGSETDLHTSITNTSRTLTAGQAYYIRVRPYDSSNNSGTYRIGFNTSIIPPGITPITLTENQWADGNLQTSDDYQWFVFTSAASTQYIHAAFGTLDSMSGIYVQVYDSGGAEAGSETDLSISTTNTSRTLTAGQTYYIRVRVTPNHLSSGGTYWIGFTASTTAPNLIQLPSNTITLTENQWADGDLPTSSSQEWFKFTAAASTQYIHFSTTGTLKSVYVQVYDSGGAEAGSETGLFGTTTNTSRTLTEGQTYYIRVRTNYPSGGTYLIAFNTSTTTPPVQLPTDTITLTANQWAEGNLPTSSSQEWFTFTATASIQYIHAAFGTLNGTLGGIYVQVYDSDVAAVEREIRLGSATNISRTLTVGQIYYIRVRPFSSSYSGTYRIGFTASFAPPSIQLTENQWAAGSITTSGGEQWFTFTATASTHYIHFSTTGTLKDVYVQVYTSNNTVVGSETNLYSSNTYFSLPLTSGQTYYIRVKPYNGSGTYRITFNTSFISPVQ